MKKLAATLGIASLLLGATIAARADTLNIVATADNQFTAYLSNSDSALGTLIGANNPSDADWKTAVSLTTDALAGTPLFLHIVMVNWTPTNGYEYQYGPSNPSAFLADLKITGSDYVFVDGSQSISTSTATFSGSPIWTGSSPSDPGTWLTPTNAVASYGANTDPTIWFINRPGKNPDVTDGAEWIAYGNQLTILYTDLSIELMDTRTNAGGEAPLPAAWTMMLLGLAGAGSVSAFRRKQRGSRATA